MVVKEKRGRRRYVAFHTDRKITDEELLAAFTSTFSPKGIKVPKVIQFDGCKGIFRCPPSDKDRVIDALAHRTSNVFSLVTLSTSGTLRTLREKYFVVDQRR
jgi:RNase P/RNase MRP subunit POP5